MKFSVGVFDALFGEKVMVEVPLPDGSVVKRRVTRKWVEKMEREGRMSRADNEVVRVHVLGPDGYYTTTWTVGEDIQRETVQKFFDKPTNAIYVMTFYREGQSEMRVLRRELWERARQAFDSMPSDMSPHDVALKIWTDVIQSQQKQRAE